jgi:hypothetical protein
MLSQPAHWSVYFSSRLRRWSCCGFSQGPSVVVRLLSVCGFCCALYQGLTIGSSDRGGCSFGEPRRGVDDWDQASSFVAARPRRSTSSLDYLDRRIRSGSWIHRQHSIECSLRSRASALRSARERREFRWHGPKRVLMGPRLGAWLIGISAVLNGLR